MGNSRVIDALCATLQGIEQAGVFSPGDPALMELRRSVLCLIADLRTAKKVLDPTRAEVAVPVQSIWLRAGLVDAGPPSFATENLVKHVP